MRAFTTQTPKRRFGEWLAGGTLASVHALRHDTTRGGAAMGPRGLPPDTCTCTCLKQQSPPSACVSSCHAHDSILVQPPLTPQGLLASRSRRTLPRCRTCSTRRTAATTCPRRRCVAPAPPRCHVCARERGSRQRAPQQREGAASVCIRELPSMSFVEWQPFDATCLCAAQRVSCTRGLKYENGTNIYRFSHGATCSEKIIPGEYPLEYPFVWGKGYSTGTQGVLKGTLLVP